VLVSNAPGRNATATSEFTIGLLLATLDYDAPFDALESGHLAGAGLDVHPAEPVPSESRLFSAPNVVMTPHLAGASRQVAHNAAGIVAREVQRFLAGSPLLHCQNPAAGGSISPEH
jgi:D-3-phosphoglycerate dehydrogenase / 2-oxoglutarate reductase